MTDPLAQAQTYLWPHFYGWSRPRRVALRCVLEKWSTFDRDGWSSREQASQAIYEQVYGSVIAILLIETIATAALSWLVEKLLDRWWGKEGMSADGDFFAKMTEFSKAI